MTMLPDDVPEGWTLAKFAEVLDFKGGSQPPKSEFSTEPRDGYVRLLQIRDFESDRHAVYIKDNSKWPKCGADDIMVGRYGASIGKVLTGKAGAYNVALVRMTFNHDVTDGRWVKHFLNSDFFQKPIRLLSRSAQNGFNKDEVSDLDVPIPPLAEQQRIVTKVEALQARSRSAWEALETVPAMLEQLRQSVLIAAFRGNLTANWREQHPDLEPASALLDSIRKERRRRWEQIELAKYQVKAQQPPKNWRDDYVEPEPVDDSELPELPDGWCWSALDELVEVQLGQRRAPEFAKLKEYPYIRSANITWQGLDLSDVKTMGFANPDSLQIQAGDVLLNEASGSPTEVGKPALWRGEIPNCCFQATVLRLRSRTRGLRPEWLFYNCLRDAILGEYAAKTPGIGIIHLTAKLLRTWPIPLAPIEEQNEVVVRLETALKVIHTLEESVAKSLAELNDLDQSILAKAFRGELVPQDPNDEPASVLLDRIRAEREQATESPTKSNGRAPRRQKRKAT